MKMTKKKLMKLAKRAQNKAEYEWREAIKLRDNYQCQVCKRHLDSPVAMHVHHIIPREFKQLKTDINNGILLCVTHHKWGKYSAHLNALWFSDWLQKNKNSTYNYLLQKLEELQQLEDTKILSTSI